MISEQAGTIITIDIEHKVWGNVTGAKFQITNITVDPENAICATLYNDKVFNWYDEQDVSSSNNATIDIYYKENISLNKSQGSGGSNSVLYNYYDYSMDPISVPSRTGYTFKGYFDENTNTLYQPGTVYTVTESVVFVAQWEEN